MAAHCSLRAVSGSSRAARSALLISRRPQHRYASQRSAPDDLAQTVLRVRCLLSLNNELSGPNPYFDKETRKWYWWDTDRELFGPYDTEDDANVDLQRYIVACFIDPENWGR
jgi:hypothetical protein